MGSSPSRNDPPKVCLIPPLIRKRHARPICANEFLYFGRPTTELLGDYFGESPFVKTDMVLKPQIRVKKGHKQSPHTPEVTAFLEGIIQPNGDPTKIVVDQLAKTAGMRISLEARWKNQMRAIITMKGSENQRPEVYLGLGRENVRGTSFIASIDPRPESLDGELGITHAWLYGSAGLSASMKGAGNMPVLAAWAAVKPTPAMSFGANLRALPTAEGRFVPDADFAINIKDPDALIYDRPAYEISLKTLSLGKSFSLAYFQHFVIRRKIYNPMEQSHVTHITNYIDVGAEVTVEKDKMLFGIGSSWQLNKNNLVKARLNKDSLQASYVLKTWANPSFTLALNTGYNFAKNLPQYGLGFTCEASLGQAEFDRAGADYEEVHVVRYGAEAAPDVNRYDMINDDSPLLKSDDPALRLAPAPVSNLPRTNL